MRQVIVGLWRNHSCISLYTNKSKFVGKVRACLAAMAIEKYALESLPISLWRSPIFL